MVLMPPSWNAYLKLQILTAAPCLQHNLLPAHYGWCLQHSALDNIEQTLIWSRVIGVRYSMVESDLPDVRPVYLVVCTERGLAYCTVVVVALDVLGCRLNQGAGSPGQ